MQLSENLSLLEMTRSTEAKRNGISNEPTPEHIENMKALAIIVFQPIRKHFGVPIHISSGYRSEALNNKIGGSKTSQHSLGQAMDIDMDGTNVSNKEVFEYIAKNMNFDQLIWEFGSDENPDWVHVSYNPKGKQRKEILKAKKINGKTTYTKITVK